MTHPNAAKGAKWERDVVGYLAEVFGRQVRRPRQEGYEDVGDVHLSPFCLQAKDEAKHSFASYVRDAELQATRAEEDYGVAVVKRRQARTEEGYVVLSLRTFRDLARRLRAAEASLQTVHPIAYAAHVDKHKRRTP